MTVWVVTYYHDIVEICDSKAKAMGVIEEGLEDFVSEGHLGQSTADEVLRDLRERGDSWLYHIEPWDVY